MNTNYELIKSKFFHLNLEGTSYQIGQSMGKFFKTNVGFVNFLSSGKLNYQKIGTTDFQGVRSLYEDYCPGINDELQGLADRFNIDSSKLIFYMDSYYLPTNCSHFAVLSPITIDKHIYVGRSYEWTHNEEDLVLATTRAKDKYSHIGFTCLLSGRHDGMNEHGLTITASGGGIFNVPTKSKGLRFWIVIRSLLEQCKTVEEAKELIMRMPLSQFTNYLLVDGGDTAILIESADGDKSFKEINAKTHKSFLISTNHYILEPMVKYNDLNIGIINHSKIRNNLITSRLEILTPKISKEDVRELLFKRYPKGLTDHHYKQYFGTLWSILFDISEKILEICFGAPTHNGWKTFNLQDSILQKEYQVIFPNVNAKYWL